MESVNDMPQDTGPDTGVGAMRLILEYEGDEVRLVSQQRVDMALTGAQTPPEARSGHFAVVRDATDREMSRVPVSGIQPTAEVFPENAGDPIIRIVTDTPRGAFTVVVPAPAAAASIALLEVTAPPARDLPPGVSPAPGKPTEKVLGVFPIEPEGNRP